MACDVSITKSLLYSNFRKIDGWLLVFFTVFVELSFVRLVLIPLARSNNFGLAACEEHSTVPCHGKTDIMHILCDL